MNSKYMAHVAASAAAILILGAVAIQSVQQPNVALAESKATVLHKRIAWPNVHRNVKTDFNENVSYPSIQPSAFIHPFAIVIGDCYIGKMVLMAPTAVCRGDEGTPIHVSDYSNIQDGVVLHALETTEAGKNLDGRKFSAGGDRLLGNDTGFDEGYAIWVGERTSLAHRSLFMDLPGLVTIRL